jgi:hypothetical protein
VSVINYVGRTVDIAAFQGFSGGAEAMLRQTLADDGKSGQVITGIIKLGQRFLIELLTEQGSIPFMPARGTTFMTEARNGSIRTPGDLLAAFSRALITIQRNLAIEDQDTPHDDEKFGGAEIQNVELSSGNAKVFVQLSSQDPAAQVILPVSLALN